MRAQRGTVIATPMQEAGDNHSASNPQAQEESGQQRGNPRETYRLHLAVQLQEGLPLVLGELGRLVNLGIAVLAENDGIVLAVVIVEKTLHAKHFDQFVVLFAIVALERPLLHALDRVL